MTTKIYRNIDLINKRKDLKLIYKLKNVPVFMGTTKKKSIKSEKKENLNFYISRSSGSVQLNPILPLKVVYSDEHGSGRVGKTWENHHKEFSKFISKKCSDTIFEIGSGHFKLFENYMKIKKDFKWIALEPNPQKKIESNKLKIIKKFYYNRTKITDNATIIHSHFIEHLYDPLTTMSGISKKMKPNQLMIFSIPNLKEMIKRGYFNTMNFEHTYFASEDFIQIILQRCNLKVIEKRYFRRDHSIFYRVIKVNKSIKKNVSFYNENEKLFSRYFSLIEKQIELVNKKINKVKNVVIHGGHVFTQLAIAYGLDISNILFITDNDINKENKYLHGTQLIIKNPNVLKNKNNYCVIISFTGVYKNEIKQGLKKINNKIKFI